MKGIPIPADPFGERGPGAHLRQAREAANISADKIAASLLLDPKIIEALEADSFDRLPAPTFVRGYLRGYARLLGLPAGPILEMYDRHGFQPPPLALGVAETPQAHTSDIVVRLVTYAVGAVLVLLVGLWWHSQGGEGFDISGDLFDWSSDPALDPSLPAVEAPGTAPVDGEPITTAPGQLSESLQDYEPPAPSPTEDAASGDIAADGPVPADGEAGGEPIAMAPGQSSESSQDDGPLAPSPAEGAASGDIAADGPVPADGEAGGEPIAMAPGQSSESLQDYEPPAPSPAEGAASGDIAADGPVPADGEAGGEPITTAPGQPSESLQDYEPPAPSPAEGVASGDIAADGPVLAEAVVPETMTGRETSTTPAPQSDVATGADPNAEAGSAGADGEDTPAPDGTDRADAASESGSVTLPAMTPPAVPDTAQSGLVLEFPHESWVEVYDRERTRLFFGLVQPGRVLNINGAQPLDVLLGFGKGRPGGRSMGRHSTTRRT